MRFLASSTRTLHLPDSSNLPAALSPAGPAPTTTTRGCIWVSPCRVCYDNDTHVIITTMPSMGVRCPTRHDVVPGSVADRHKYDTKYDHHDLLCHCLPRALESLTQSRASCASREREKKGTRRLESRVRASTSGRPVASKKRTEKG